MSAARAGSDGTLTKGAGRSALWPRQARSSVDHTARASKPLVVEFVGGIAGVGKSTIAHSCHALAAKLGYTIYLQNDVNDFFTSKGVPQRLRALLGAPLVWQMLYCSLWSPPFRRRKSDSILSHYWRCVAETRLYFVLLYEFAKRNPNCIVILDQWMSRRLDIKDPQRTMAALRLIGRFDGYFAKHYVFVNVPTAVSTDRAWRRAWRRQTGRESGWTRDFHLDKDALYQEHAAKRVLYERLQSVCEMHGMRLLKLDGERPPEENAGIILDRIIKPYVAQCRG